MTQNFVVSSNTFLDLKKSLLGKIMDLHAGSSNQITTKCVGLLSKTTNLIFRYSQNDHYVSITYVVIWNFISWNLRCVGVTSALGSSNIWGPGRKEWLFYVNSIVSNNYHQKVIHSLDLQDVFIGFFFLIMKTIWIISDKNKGNKMRKLLLPERYCFTFTILMLHIHICARAYM